MNQLGYLCQASSSLTSGVPLVSSSATQPMPGEAAIPASFPCGAARPPSICTDTAGYGEDSAQIDPPLATDSPLGRFCTTAAKRAQMGSRGWTGPSAPPSPPWSTLARRLGALGPFPAWTCPQDRRQHTGFAPARTRTLPKKPQHLFYTRNEAAKT